MMRAPSFAFAALLAGITVSGCSNPAKGEAASLVASVDRFRKAENPGKPALLPAVQAAACTDRDVCAAKEACLAYAVPTAQGLTLKADVQRVLADLEDGGIDKNSDAARSLPAKLDEASHLLDVGHAALTGCDERVLNLRLHFAL